MRGRAALLLCLASAAAGADAQTIVSSAGPDRVAVTLYRDPNRAVGDAVNANWLNGFALVSETRQVTLPAGETELRFEGVAGGIVPQSAIVTGLPDGVVERNRDAYLLSPESLLDRSLGRRIHLRRTSRATGAVTEQDAVVRTGADGAVVLETAAGFEALRCTGLPEMPVYDGVPPGLAARPTLSVRTRSSRPVSATVTLSYLSSGFDWQANYVATLSPDGAHVALFAWLVLASGDETSFVDADTQAIAGRLNRERVERDEPAQRALQLRCWPQATTSDIPLEELDRRGGEGGLMAVSPVTVISSEEIRLQGNTRTEDLINSLPEMMARQENLGDLKLYRIPEPVTVAAHSLKQVAFLQRSGVPVEIVHRRFVYPGDDDADVAHIFLLTRNRPEEQLGIPLPGGRVQLFRDEGSRSLLIGEGEVRDHAVGEEVEIDIGEAPGVVSRVTRAPGGRRNDYLLTVTNDQSYPVRFEATFRTLPGNMRARDVELGRRNGLPAWTVTVPANGSATLRYRLRRRGD
ncbi:MAG: hypothetical protein QOD42_689 [Sphingomonadales bacterium]|jgi:hypothetical protein|nr:hypothetical protein [Sphingomonadales bacterium]